MADTGLPGPFTRLLRHRLAIAPLVVLTALAMVTGQVSESASVTLQGEVDAHWRGTYDILVRPLGSRLRLEQTAGLVEPNFLGFAGKGGMSEEQLAQIRSMPNVQFAAPVAVVGYVRYVFAAPSVFTSVLPAQPTLYRLTATATTNDGLGDRLIQRRSSRLLLGPADLTATEVPFASDEQGLNYGTDGLSVGLPELPGIISPLIAVDPAAERELLGGSGAVLDPLVAIPGRQSLRTGTFDVSRIPDQFDSERFFVSMLASGTDGSETRPIVPVIVSDRLFASMRMSLRVEQVGQPLGRFPPAGPGLERLAAAEVEAGPGTSLIGMTELDATAALRPFGTPSLTLLWPGSTPPDGTELASRVDTEFDARLASRPEYRRVADPGGRLTFEIAARGPVGPTGDSDALSPATGTVERGSEQSYRDLVPTPLAIGSDFTPANPFDRPFVFAPVGEFALGSIDLPRDPLTYVPLGAYNPPDTLLVAGPDGVDLPDPIAMTPTLNAAGLIGVPPLAITDLPAARLLRGARPIDVVRVRVRGLAGFDDAGRARVERVAAAISELGLDVDIVAGSSPQRVDVVVPGYFPDDAALGVVTQEWTTLGAAERVTTALGGTNFALLLLAATSGVILAIGAEILVAATRTREAAVLSAIGWTRQQIASWFGAEALLLILIVGLAALIGSGFGSRPIGLVVGLLIAAVAAAVRTSGAIVMSHLSGPGARASGDAIGLSLARRLGPVRGLSSFALRDSIGRGVRSATTLASLGVAAAAAGLGVSAIIGAMGEAGPTNLATALSGTLRPYQSLMLAVIAVGGLICATLLTRLDLAERQPVLRTLAAAGWEPRDVRALLARQFVLVVGAACVVAIGLAMALAAPVAAVDVRLVVTTSVGMLLAWLVVSVVVAHRIAHRANQS